MHPELHALNKCFETTPAPSLYPCPACHTVFPTFQTWELHFTDRERDCRESIHSTSSPLTECLLFDSIITMVDGTSSLSTFSSSEVQGISPCCEQFPLKAHPQNRRPEDIQAGAPPASATATTKEHRSFLFRRSSRKTDKCRAIVPVPKSEERQGTERTNSWLTWFAKFGASASQETGCESNWKSVAKKLIAHIRMHS